MILNTNQFINKKIFIIIFFLIKNLCSQNSDFSVLQINDGTVKIDGELDETAWRKAFSINQFFNHFPKDTGSVEKPISIRIFHDSTTIYFGITVEENTDKYIVSSLKRDEIYDDFIKGDGFAIICDPTGEQNSGFFFGVNVKGVQSDGIISIVNDNYSIDSSWNTKWKTQTKIKDSLRIYEIAIPINAIPHSLYKSTWNFNFLNVDAKVPQHGTLTSFPRNYNSYDLRFTKKMILKDLSKNKSKRFTAIPYMVYNYGKTFEVNEQNKKFDVGGDLKYNLSPSLKLEATINPDFSTIELDNQITNLTRFDISYEERRNFFLENGDLYNNLGTRGVNPFYSRIIGSESLIQYGVKFSGNLSTNLRVGALSATTGTEDDKNGQNYSVLVGRQKLSKSLTTTAYLVNRQELGKTKIQNNYNRVSGLNINYISSNNKWLGQIGYGKSFSPDIKKKNNHLNAALSYSTRSWLGSTTTSYTQKNYITDVGFVPRLNNFDAALDETIREDYIENYTEIIYNNYKPSNLIRDKNEHKIRFTTFLDSNLKMSEEEIELVNIWRYKDLGYFFFNVFFNHNNLKYSTQILNNDKILPPAIYNSVFARGGYISSPNKVFSFQNRYLYGNFYNGTRFNIELITALRLQPWAKINADYNLNLIDLKEYGEETFHTLNFSSSVFFNKKLSWTTLMQLNTQKNNIGFNARLQWEFGPLSFLYIVFSNNYNPEDFNTKNYGFSIKANHWLDF
ncbi:DUF5916 domain-containing protein [Flavivirga sp. 57AJ16]|uniref:DUF5916 domain-containing protein n=1 Tax=Flavivirga sp. 57AJ16 TaxID=3025307 RepID=UPI00236720C9|nr:DUF5916 domain-containing protein [Flavivirga sp. 57AJ16]MDD7885470.1 DUF5916 domain-containing protein [Flavivirga sp. 57AJ16]